MNRKTNLFYKAGSNDSKFITFSNYSESLTGNFLSTNTKLFPSTFMCLYIPKLDVDMDFLTAKQELIDNYLVAYYENKLALLRDAVLEDNQKAEDVINPFAYLMEALYKFDPDTKIVYVNNIAENDYNGTYTDTICIVDMESYKCGSLEEVELNELHMYPSKDGLLYGWYTDDLHEGESDYESKRYIGPSDYEGLMPVFDADNSYYRESTVKVVLDDAVDSAIKFNVLIPLFDVINMDEVENTFDVGVANRDALLDEYLKNDEDKVIGQRNIPLGMWFSGSSCVELDNSTEYAPTWSLTIGAQFKAFPTSSKLTSDISKNSTSAAFSTFAEVLLKQNKLYDLFNTLMDSINSLSVRMTALESNVSSIATTANLDALQAEVVKLSNTVKSNTQQIENIYNTVSDSSLAGRLQWIEK